jgi:hypothetical protein
MVTQKKGVMTLFHGQRGIKGSLNYLLGNQARTEVHFGNQPAEKPCSSEV